MRTGGDDYACNIQGPSGAVPVQLTDNGDGTYKVNSLSTACTLFLICSPAFMLLFIYYTQPFCCRSRAVGSSPSLSIVLTVRL
jgi:hypothetical protein